MYSKCKIIQPEKLFDLNLSIYDNNIKCKNTRQWSCMKIIQYAAKNLSL